MTEMASCPFLHRLPRELRDEVYSYLLIDNREIQMLANFHLTRGLGRGRKLSTQILRVSRQVYTEASAVLYGQNTFYLWPWPLESFSADFAARLAEARATTLHLREIRNFSVISFEGKDIIHFSATMFTGALEALMSLVTLPGINCITIEYGTDFR